MFMMLASLYPAYSMAFITCFILDFGSHWLQFQSSACLKATSHKGKNEKEHWVIAAYYNNYTIFAITVLGAEFATGFLFITAKVPELQENMIWMAVTSVLTCILAFKMLVNCFQWTGATQRFVEYEEEELKKKLGLAQQ